MDGTSGILPLHPASSMNVLPGNTQLRQFAGHTTFGDHGRGEYVEPESLTHGRRLFLAPEDPESRIRIESAGNGELLLPDGRSVAQNGCFDAVNYRQEGYSTC